MHALSYSALHFQDYLMLRLFKKSLQNKQDAWTEMQIGKIDCKNAQTSLESQAHLTKSRVL